MTHSGKIPVLGNDGYSCWKGRMRVFLLSLGQDIWDATQSANFVVLLVAQRTTPVIVAQHEANAKAINFLFSGLGPVDCERVSHLEPTRQIWSLLSAHHEGTATIKGRLVETYRREYENFVQKPGESIDDLFGRFQSIINKLLVNSSPERIPYTDHQQAVKLLYALDRKEGFQELPEGQPEADKAFFAELGGLCSGSSSSSSSSSSLSDEEIITKRDKRREQGGPAGLCFVSIKSKRKHKMHQRSFCSIALEDKDDKGNDNDSSNEEDRGLEDIWIIDSGCSRHMIGHRRWFSSLIPVSTKEYITFKDNGQGKVLGVGSIALCGMLSLREVALARNLGFNLVLVPQLLKEGFEVELDGTETRIAQFESKKGLSMPPLSSWQDGCRFSCTCQSGDDLLPRTVSWNEKNHTLVEMAQTMLDERDDEEGAPIFEDEEGAVDAGDARATAPAIAPAPSAMSSEDEGGPLPTASFSLPQLQARVEAGPAEDTGEVTFKIVPSR
ncbi:hypothetical protein BS78_K193000 [Paspalum vaginatum]|uniref:Retrovirus-related Pol polyprotein from transposon TNT 1-94-like beta-barrel domain-containing protein n=1 Tax=Paspalum vaginatum TaxID=158149 RepID=A0A9W8CCN2_9POAL|nr:hypothetical protein BS78_K193000 [Paspalum vaginatum]